MVLGSQTNDSECNKPPAEVRREVLGNINKDIVYMKRNKTDTGHSTKLYPRFKGPLVIQILLADTNRVQSFNSVESTVSTPQSDTISHPNKIRISRRFVDDIGNNEYELGE